MRDRELAQIFGGMNWKKIIKIIGYSYLTIDITGRLYAMAVWISINRHM